MSISSSEHPVEIETSPSPTATVIWLHGLGADGNDFAPVVPELHLPDTPGIRFIFPHAPFRPVTCNGGYVMRAWYDIYSLENFDKEDEAGHKETQQFIEGIIQNEIERGIPAQRIILMGFSQGGAAALYTGLRYPQKLAGLGALSTYLPLRDRFPNEANEANKDIAIFMAHGQYDPVVLYQYGEASRHYLNQHGYAVEWHDYPMEHSVCAEEIDAISHWLATCLS